VLCIYLRGRLRTVLGLLYLLVAMSQGLPYPGHTSSHQLLKEMWLVNTLIVTDIRKSGCDDRFDLITAVVSNVESFGESSLLDAAKKRRCNMLVIESVTATEEIPARNVHKGDLIMRLWARSNHGLAVGEEITLDGQKRGSQN